jgi:O-antigen/teichoic acid export membrane protein
VSGTGGAAPADRPARDAAWSTLATVAGTGLRTLSVLIATRMLGAAGFGTYTLGRILVTMLGVVSTLGLAPGLLPFLASARRDGDLPRLRALARSSWRLAALTAAVGGALLWALAPWLAQHAFHDPALAGVLRGLAALAGLAALGSVTFTILQAFQRVRAAVLIEQLLVLGVTVVALLVAWWADWGMAGVVGASLLAPLLGLLVALQLARQLVPGLLQAAAPAAAPAHAELLAACWPIMGASLVALAVGWLDVLLVGVFRDAREVGIYGSCARLATVVVLVHESVGPVFAARLSQLHAERDPAAIGRLYQLTGRWSLWSALIVGWAFVLWRRELLGLFGPEFVEGAPVLGLLVLSRVLLASSGMCARLLALTGRQRSNFLNAALMLVANAALDVLWIPAHGALGAAAAACASIALGKALQVVEVWRFYRILPWSGRGLLALPATAALAGAAHLAGDGLHAVPWWIAAALFAAAGALLYVLLGADDEERAALRAARQRRGW